MENEKNVNGEGAQNETRNSSGQEHGQGSQDNHSQGEGSQGQGSQGQGSQGNGSQGQGSSWERVVTEEFRVSGEAVVSKVKELVREGNVRRIIIKNDEGRTLIEVPLTIGVITTVLLPVWAAIGAIAALAANLTLTVERRQDTAPAATESKSSDAPSGNETGHL